MQIILDKEIDSKAYVNWDKSSIQLMKCVNKTFMCFVMYFSYDLMHIVSEIVNKKSP